jgi:hypothetical protein
MLIRTRRQAPRDIGRSLLARLLVLIVCAVPLRAQESAAAAIGLGGIDNLLRRVESIDIYYGGSIGRPSEGTSTTARLPWGKDYGLEFLVHVAEVGPLSAAQRRRSDDLARTRQASLDSLRQVRAARLRAVERNPAARDSMLRRFATDSARIVAAPEQPFNATSITIRKHVSVVGKDTVLVGVDSEIVGNRLPPPPEERAIDFDLGIGYGQMDGLSLRAPFELHGSVRELPSISAYATVRVSDRFGVYAGVRTGVVTLQDAQLYVSDATSSALFSLSSTSFEFGAPLGLDYHVAADLHVTLEAAYMRRVFNSLSYDPPAGIPADAPRTLDLSGMSWSLGIQIPMP